MVLRSSPRSATSVTPCSGRSWRSSRSVLALHTMSDDAAGAVRALRSQPMDGALEAVEGVDDRAATNLEALVVVVAAASQVAMADLTFVHGEVQAPSQSGDSRAERQRRGPALVEPRRGVCHPQDTRARAGRITTCRVTPRGIAPRIWRFRLQIRLGAESPRPPVGVIRRHRPFLQPLHESRGQGPELVELERQRVIARDGPSVVELVKVRCVAMVCAPEVAAGHLSKSRARLAQVTLSRLIGLIPTDRRHGDVTSATGRDASRQPAHPRA